MKKKDITLIYSLQQFSYWAAIGGFISFAASYLLGKGYSAAQIGWILFAGNIFSFLLQPVAASYADKAKTNVLLKLTFFLALISVLCFSAVRFLPLPRFLFTALYIAGAFFSDMEIPLQNSIISFYTAHSYSVNYGLGRAMGSIGFAIATLIYGRMIETMGADSMILVSLIMMLIFIGLVFFYPHEEKENAGSGANGSEETSSLFEFFGKYKWYTISLFGTLCLALFHIMVENYLIEIVTPFGGDNSTVGVALFIATVVETVTMLLIPGIRQKIGSYKVFLIAGISYAAKAVLFATAHSVTQLYIAQLLQATSYTFLSGVQMYYAQECTNASDMVKGQSMITAFYTLGCALGNLLGGNLITSFGLPVMLYFGIAITVIGLLILMITVPKSIIRKTSD